MVLEQWRDIGGYEGSYQISDLGRVKSLSRIIWNGQPKLPRRLRERILRPIKSNTGYLNVKLCSGGFTSTMQIHQIVAATFIPNPNNKSQVNHRNGVKTDNRATNLEWHSALENTNHARSVLGYDNSKELNGQAKLTQDQILQIRHMYMTGEYLQREIGEIFGIHQAHVSRIILGKLWR